jgi:hypothetical protein
VFFLKTLQVRLSKIPRVSASVSDANFEMYRMISCSGEASAGTSGSLGALVGSFFSINFDFLPEIRQSGVPQTYASAQRILQYI